MSRGLRVARDFGVPLLLGAAAFWLIVGFKIVNPSNIAWLEQNDPLTHYLGWQFFRTSPWLLPLGASPNYGLAFSNSVMYSDSLPLFAIPFKLVSPLLPKDFQYSGLWLLTCFLLQAVFAWKLIGLISRSFPILFASTALFLFLPPMVWRLTGHLTLVGHFVILAALYLSFRPRQDRRIVDWAALIAITSLIHAYLLFMVLALWSADFFGYLLRRPADFRRPSVSAEILVVPVVLGIVCWQAGYFMVGESVSGNGFGFFRMNVISLVDSNGWSNILRDFPGGNGDYEGFNFLGLGGMLLVLFALPGLLVEPQRVVAAIRYRPVLLVALMILTALALSTNIGVGVDNYLILIPDWATKLLNVFRASGRLFWPVYYVIVLASVYFVVRSYRPMVAVVLLGVAFAMQVIDTSPGWTPLREKYTSRDVLHVPSPLRSPFWQQAAPQYSTLRLLMPMNEHPNWRPFASYASASGMATDATYLARVSRSMVQAAQDESLRELRTGQYDAKTLYVVDKQKLLQAVLSLHSDRDLLAKIDGFYVIAPGWKTCVTCLDPGHEVHLADVLTPMKRGSKVLFTANSRGTEGLVSGWSGPEPWGTWTESGEAEFIVVMSGMESHELLIDGNAFVDAKHRELTVDFQVNEGAVVRKTFNKFGINTFTLPVPDRVQTDREDSVLRIRVRPLNPARPADSDPLSEDTRLLGFGLISVTLQ